MQIYDFCKYSGKVLYLTDMKKSILIPLLALLLGISASAQNRQTVAILSVNDMRSEERRVGKEC